MLAEISKGSRKFDDDPLAQTKTYFSLKVF